MRLFLRLGDASTGPLEAPDRVRYLLLAHDERRQQPHDVVAGRGRDHFLCPQLVDELSTRHCGAQTDEESFALLSAMGMPFAKTAETQS